MKQALIKHVPSSAVLEIGNMQKPVIFRDSSLPSSLLNVSERVTYKLCVMVHSCLQGQAPQYLVDLCLPVSDIASRQHLSLRSAKSASPVANVQPTGFFCGCRPGTYCLTIWEIRVSPETASADFWKHICSLCTEAFSTLEVYENALYKSTILTYLLTYLYTYKQ